MTRNPEPPATRAELARDVWKRLFAFLMSTAAERNQVLGKHDLTPNDSRALFALDPSEGRTMGSLAAEWACDASYATSVVDRLEARGFATRRARPGDRRVKLVVLTPRGVKIRQTLERAIYQPPRELLDLPAPDLRALWLAATKLPPPR